MHRASALGKDNTKPTIFDDAKSNLSKLEIVLARAYCGHNV